MEFSFHSPKALGQWSEEIQEMFDQLKHKGAFKGSNAVLFEGLKRGIGMHHEACKTQYKQAVEVLFRRGYLRVVFATKTLALGINMPCRATVFCGDSLELDGLMYRQMSGRAGRRGFDLLGHVIFIDVPFAKTSQLMSSELPMLSGVYSITPTLVLRSMQQLEQLHGKDKDETRKLKVAQVHILEPMFKECFAHAEISTISEKAHAAVRAQLLQHLRYMTNLLYTEHLVTKEGKLSQFAGMCTFLFEIEPSNLALNRLFCSGVLHRYLEYFDKRRRRKSETLWNSSFFEC